MVLALVGVLNGISPSSALIPPWPKPVQPFLADADGGFADTTLGLTNINNYTITNIQRGSRTTLPWIYSGPGFGLEVDKNMETGLPLGDVYSYVDAICDSTSPEDVDILMDLPCNGTIHKLIWSESKTAVEGDSTADWLKSIVPPYSWLARHTANITNICLYSASGTANPTINELNTVYTNVPFSPNGSAYTATTKLGGNPAKPPVDTCLDSPQSSTSVTSLYRTPKPEGDSDRHCDTGAYTCADAVVNGVWTDSTNLTLIPGAAETIQTVKSVNMNNGPAESGAFSAHWDVELTNPDIMNAGWNAGFAKTEDVGVTLAKSTSTADPNDLHLQCTAGPGEGLVVIKKILWPIPNTKDTYADDNAFVFVEKVICGSGPTNLVDKEVIWIKPMAIVPLSLNPDSPNLGSTPHHLQLVSGQEITVKVDELKANHHTAPVDGHEWLVAEVSNVVPLQAPPEPGNHTWPAPDLFVNWETPVTSDTGGTSPKVPHAVTACAPEVLCADNLDNDADGVVNDGCEAVGEPETKSQCLNNTNDDGDGLINDGCVGVCIDYTVTEPQGQMDIQADLTIKCPALEYNPVPGLYSVVIKAIDAPVLPFGEFKPSDNAARTVIKVWCYANESAKLAADDGIEDANGLYARWTAFQSVGLSALQQPGDVQKSYKSPPSIASDTGYVERIVDLQCFWLDEDGCATCDGSDITAFGGPASNTGHPDGYINEKESWNDPDLVAAPWGGIDAVDNDRDCAMAAGKAQPSHPVDEKDTKTGTLCFAGQTPNYLPYSEDPNFVRYDTAADQDCDGLVDGVERAWGSNPQLDDSDGDGAPDFVEMFQQTNPLNPDTDGDGLSDKPEDDYQAVAAGSNETGETVTDDNCPGIYNPDQANNDAKRRPNGDFIEKTFASNPNQDKKGDACDDDDDNDTLPDTNEATAGSNPLVMDSDGDTVVDGAEIIYKKDPMVGGTNKPAWSAAIQQKFYRGCHTNLPKDGTYGSTTWDTEYDGTLDDVEMNLDGDDTLCPTDSDSDNGTGTGLAAPDEYDDKIEAYGFALGIGNKDTDGDGCEDWIEMTDVTGNRSANSVDVLAVAMRGMASGPGDAAGDLVLDLNKNGSINSVDVLYAAKNSTMLKAHATCAVE